MLINVTSTPSPDYFFDAYDRDDIAYGTDPSGSLAAYLDQTAGHARGAGRAIDLGAGAGRDTLALAAAGYAVESVDLSERGLARIAERAAERGLTDRIRTRMADVCHVDFPPSHYDAVIATTVLDHISAAAAEQVWQRMCDALSATGFLYVQVHTTEDPGSDQPPGNASSEPVSETAGAVINYFRPNQLAAMAVRESSNLRILRYEERLEWDYTHGPEHQHGKAVLLAVRAGFHPHWYGQPAAFPRRSVS
ncbi:class I SAM-dependent methyltransferase [Allorhodopirellula heiligendammensis]|uniref:Tellurite methyltransferase n=1 Tax=Allorhodopirellula heiligendammensis TaxID=2714739 RepID=A0A5C6BYX5_9BACT|nr:class I SAM-dependent methyltransferase [Allorhodopirellula heiligendammensis]TWU15789.1 Tellurite methyltransferase [Allorhodopirellula heiligendammensis]